MLREMTSTQLAEWRVYDELEPFGPERDDYRFASIPFGMRREVPSGGIRLLDFVVPFGDAPELSPVKQSVEYQEMLIDSWILVSNAIFAAKGTN